MDINSDKTCRKCGTKNPKQNDYCRRCGALLAISTTLIKAQKGPVLPLVKEVRVKYVILGAAAMLGLITVLLVAGGAVALLLFDVSLGSSGGGSGSGNLIAVLVGTGVLFLLGFGIGGFALSWLLKGRPIAESVIATFLVLALLAAIGYPLSNDAPIIAAIWLLPSVLAAALGNKLGKARGGN